jgi:hypothetical protein
LYEEIEKKEAKASRASQLDHVDFEVEFLESGALYKFKWAFTSAK